MLNDSTRLRCPTSKKHVEFSAVAHVTELWKTDDQGDFLEVLEGIETTHQPDENDVFECCECSSQAHIVTITQPRDCANCGRRWNKDELADIDKLYERVEEGEIMPSGECPFCGALCYISKEHNVKEEP